METMEYELFQAFERREYITIGNNITTLVS